jgi:hypothetical protein
LTAVSETGAGHADLGFAETGFFVGHPAKYGCWAGTDLDTVNGAYEGAYLALVTVLFFHHAEVRICPETVFAYRWTVRVFPSDLVDVGLWWHAERWKSKSEMEIKWEISRSFSADDKHFDCDHHILPDLFLLHVCFDSSLVFLKPSLSRQVTIKFVKAVVGEQLQQYDGTCRSE